MGVNVAAFTRDCLRDRKWTLGHVFPPVAGFLTCLYIWLSLRTPAKLAGFAWLAIGIAYAAWKTAGFRRRIVFSDPPTD
jgi:hypothetical protein